MRGFKLTILLLSQNAPIFQACLVAAEVVVVVQDAEDPEEVVATEAVVDTIAVVMIEEDMTEVEEDMVVEEVVVVDIVVEVPEAAGVVVMHRIFPQIFLRFLYQFADPIADTDGGRCLLGHQFHPDDFNLKSRIENLAC